MSKRVVDISIEELAAMGAKAARAAVQRSRAAGQVVTGTVRVFERGKATSVLAQQLPSGTVTRVKQAEEAAGSAEAVSRGQARDQATD